jgi:pilus assembly protein CpaF
MFGRRGKSSETVNSSTPKIVSPQINSESAPSNFNLDKISIKKKTDHDDQSQLLFRERDKERYYRLKQDIFTAIIEVLDISALASYEISRARDEIRDITTEIISLRSIQITLEEQEEIVTDLCGDFLGLGPLEPLSPLQSASSSTGSERLSHPISNSPSIPSVLLCTQM